MMRDPIDGNGDVKGDLNPDEIQDLVNNLMMVISVLTLKLGGEVKITIEDKQKIAGLCMTPEDGGVLNLVAMKREVS